ncbi:MAG: hypothetical protein GY788_16910 [bacterium]|nr:hypothetical protein [bacterium]
MFRGIDPAGLGGLVIELARHCGNARQLSIATVAILGSNGRTSDAAEIAAVVGRAHNWSDQTCSTLQWRAAAVDNVQGEHFSLAANLRAHFAVSATFSMENLAETYLRWVEQSAAGCNHIDETIVNVSAWLNETWRDWDVTNADLHNIRQAIGGLSPSELEGVIAGLSQPQLERWIAEMGNRINGFSRAEKQEVFALLARSPNSLGKVHDAILAGGTPADAIDFGAAVGAAVSDAVIARFVADVLATNLKATPYSTVAILAAIGEVEEPAIVNGMVDQIVEGGALPLLVADSLAVPNGTDLLSNLGRVLGRVTDPDVAATALHVIVPFVTDAAAQRSLVTRTGNLERVRTAALALAQAEPVLLELANRLLATDPDRVIESLATTVDPLGTVFSDFLFEMVSGGESATIGTIAATLRGGDAVDPRRFASIGADPDYRYPHAQNLAYFAGSLNNALARYSDDAKDDINLITAAVAAADLVLAPVFAAFRIGLSTAMVEAGVGFGVANAVQDDIDTFLANIHDVVSTSLQPTVTVNGIPHELGESALWWDHRYRMVRSEGGS